MILYPKFANNAANATPNTDKIARFSCGPSMISDTPPTNTIPANTNFDISKK